MLDTADFPGFNHERVSVGEGQEVAPVETRPRRKSVLYREDSGKAAFAVRTLATQSQTAEKTRCSSAKSRGTFCSRISVLASVDSRPR
jgi:hypothetical protein